MIEITSSQLVQMIVFVPSVCWLIIGLHSYRNYKKQSDKSHLTPMTIFLILSSVSLFAALNMSFGWIVIVK